MTKAEIVDRIAKQTGIEKNMWIAVVETFMESVKNSMIAGEEVFSARVRQFYYQTQSTENGT